MRAWFWLGASALLSFSCSREKVKACHELMTASQGVVADIAPNSVESVEMSVASVTAALDACRAAKRDEEVTALESAHRQLSQHLKRVKERQAAQSERKLSPAQLARLTKRGDPGCPSGQAYKHRESGEEIRCTGPQPVAMRLSQAKKYFKARGYKLVKSAPSDRVVAEYGAEKIVFQYKKARDRRPPRCVTLYPPPGMSWEEATARMTGAAPFRLAKDKPVPTPIGELALKVEEEDEKLIVKLGDCAG